MEPPALDGEFDILYNNILSEEGNADLNLDEGFAVESEIFRPIHPEVVENKNTEEVVAYRTVDAEEASDRTESAAAATDKDRHRSTKENYHRRPYHPRYRRHGWGRPPADCESRNYRSHRRRVPFRPQPQQNTSHWINNFQHEYGLNESEEQWVLPMLSMARLMKTAKPNLYRDLVSFLHSSAN